MTHFAKNLKKGVAKQDSFARIAERLVFQAVQIASISKKFEGETPGGVSRVDTV